MFLNYLHSNRRTQHRIRLRMLQVIALLLTIGATTAATPLPTCFVVTPVYGPRGDRLPFRIVAATLEGDKSTNLLTTEDPQYRVVARGDRLYFPPILIGKRRVELRLVDDQGNRLVRRIALMDCRQRVSIERGKLDRGLDLSGFTVTGRLTGCTLLGDWWIRAMPMFGAQENRILHEGFIEGTDGTFRITSSMSGERHIIIIGKGKNPLKCIGADLVEGGGQNELGAIDLSDVCPKYQK